MSLELTPAGWPDGNPVRVAMAGIVLTQPLVQFLAGDFDQLPEGTGGASTAVWQLIVSLLERGRSISVVTLDPSVMRPLTAEGPLLDLFFGPMRQRHSMRDLMRLERCAVREGLMRARPDLVHAHWCGEYALGALATGIPTLVTVHDWMPAILRMTESRYWPHWSARTLLYFTTLARARYLTANSPYTSRKIRPFTRAALEVVPNGVADEDFFHGNERGAPQCLEPGSPRPVVISVNNGFSPWKNVGRLLQAFRVVRRQGTDCTLQLIGEGYGLGGPCEAWAKGERLADGVAFLGTLSREDVLARMRRSVVLAHPSREESFGLTLVEALSQRLPVIAGARSGAVPWVLGGGRAGVLVNVEDVASLAGALTAVLRQPELRERMAHQGYEYAWKNYRQSRVADLYLDIYGRVLAETGRRGRTSD